MIRQATTDDLARLAPLAAEFYAASEFLVGFDIARFCEVWRNLLARAMGVIYIDEDAGAITGTIGGIVHRELYSDELVAEEAFWFVAGASRGRGVALYRALEAWARERGAGKLHMMHLLDSMPEKVGAFYRRQGFKAAETRYVKVL